MSPGSGRGFFRALPPVESPARGEVPVPLQIPLLHLREMRPTDIYVHRRILAEERAGLVLASLTIGKVRARCHPHDKASYKEVSKARGLEEAGRTVGV